jgi:hypothetical protein
MILSEEISEKNADNRRGYLPDENPNMITCGNLDIHT